MKLYFYLDLHQAATWTKEFFFHDKNKSEVITIKLFKLITLNLFQYKFFELFLFFFNRKSYYKGGLKSSEGDIITAIDNNEFQTWRHLWKKYVDCKGDYVKK